MDASTEFTEEEQAILDPSQDDGGDVPTDEPEQPQ